MIKKCLLIEDLPIVEKAMHQLFKDAGLEGASLNSVASFNEMQSIIKKHRIDLLIIDFKFKDHGSINLLVTLAAEYPSMPILVFAEKPDLLPQIMLYKNGIKGILSMNAPLTEIIKAMRQVFSGKIYVNEAFILYFLTGSKSKNIISQILTVKEREIANLMVRGSTNVAMCGILKLQPSTISTFKKKIFNKMQVKNLIELNNALNELDNQFS